MSVEEGHSNSRGRGKGMAAGVADQGSKEADITCLLEDHSKAMERLHHQEFSARMDPSAA